MTTPLRAVLIGAGSMGRNHARILRSLEGVELVGVADPGGDPTGAAGTAPVVASTVEALALRPDYAVVATPTEWHLDVGLTLADAGVHALIEKPVANTGTEAQELAAAFDAAGLVGAVGHIERYNPGLRAARTRLEQGELGEVYQVVTRRQSPFPARIADVGVVKDLATHDIDITRWVTQRRYLTVAAQTAHKSGREFEDLVSFIGTLEGRIVTSHLVNWLSPFKERVTLITGERGSLHIDHLTADLTFYGNGTVDMEWNEMARFRGVSEGDMVRFAIAKPEPLRTEHEQFRDAVLGLDADIVSLADGAENVAIAEEILRSAETGNTISLTE